MCYTYIKDGFHKDTQNGNEQSKFTIATKSGNSGKSIQTVKPSILDIFPNFKSLLCSKIKKTLIPCYFDTFYGTESAITSCSKIFFKMLFFAGCLYDFR